jgi:hypothetical protein
LKRILSAAITVVVFGAVLWLGRGDRHAAPRPGAGADTPEQCIGRMFTAAAAGDVAAYVDCFRGPERERLERELVDGRREAFARSLQDAVGSLRGRAVFADGTIAADADAARYTVDRVYESRTERQVYDLVRESGVWRIEAVRTMQPFQPETPYGAPVFEPPPTEEEEE